jgi:hypothetical protein
MFRFRFGAIFTAGSSASGLNSLGHHSSKPMEINQNFRAIEYAEIDLAASEVLLKEQGLLLIDLGWFRARTMIALINEEKKLRSYRASRTGIVTIIFNTLLDIFHLVPLVLLSPNLVLLHCIYVNHCNDAEWKKLESGKFRFTLI